MDTNWTLMSEHAQQGRRASHPAFCWPPRPFGPQRLSAFFAATTRAGSGPLSVFTVASSTLLPPPPPPSLHFLGFSLLQFGPLLSFLAFGLIKFLHYGEPRTIFFQLNCFWHCPHSCSEINGCAHFSTLSFSQPADASAQPGEWSGYFWSRLHWTLLLCGLAAALMSERRLG